jgi:RHS repeat-associated protein
MWVPSTTGIPLQGGTVATVNNYNAATNRINGASYDTAGNLISFTGSALTYDAEKNRITSASQSGIGSMYYFYDGAGRRVQEVSTYNVEKVFVYDAFGQMAAEYSLGAQSPPCTTCYIATDHLGSTRLVTDQNANVVARHDYLPFGEEIAANTGGRDGTFGTQDFVNQKFTGQERDSETGLDFFQARYFSAALGRFNSPDPSNAGANLFNPQSWNAYTYAFNNPLTLIDPSGTSPFDGFNPSPDDPCADDPFICGDPGFPYPDFPSPWPSEQPQPQPPPPPPPPAPIVIPHSGGSYAQGQWGSFPNDGETLGLPAGMNIPGPLSLEALAPESFADSQQQIQSLYERILEHLRKIEANPNSQDIAHWEVEVRAWIREISRKATKVTQKRAPGATDRYLQRVIGVTLSDLENLLSSPIIIVNPCLTNPTLRFCRPSSGPVAM